MSRLRDDIELLKCATPEKLDACEKQMRGDFSLFVSKREHATQELAEDDTTKERAATLEQVLMNLDRQIASACAPESVDRYSNTRKGQEIASKIADEYMTLTKRNRQRGDIRGGDFTVYDSACFSEFGMTLPVETRIRSLVK
jgi:hypothetical protein